MRRKKQGASLIVVLMAFMFLFTVSTAMLSMVVSNYKARVAENKRIQNLYASDSGLDVAYNIIGKTFDAATKYANLKVTQLKNTSSAINDTSIYNVDYVTLKDDITSLKNHINDLQNWNATHTADQQKALSDIQSGIAKYKSLIKEDENMQETLCNEEFKRSFKNFIKVHSYKVGDPKYDESDDGDDQNRLGTSEHAPDKLERLINNHQYISEVIDINTYTEETIDFAIKNKNNISPNLDATVTESPVGNSYKSTGIIASSNGHDYDVSFTVYGDEFFDITVKSTFYTEEVNGNETDQRQLQATYKMLVPNYKDIYFANSNGSLNEYLATKDRALTIFGDMNVRNVTGLTVSGDIFVKDVPDTIRPSDNKVYAKYFGGITLNNSGGVNFENNVITRGTFNIQNTTTPASVKTTIGGNLYAKNVYVGKKDNSSLAGGETELNINKVIINNDLALNADNATIDIGNLYGINDEDSNDKDKAQSSSSIIVNGNKNSSIKITNSAYLMGTAHIDTEGNYQTAESGAIKGNYIAYCIPLTEEQKSKYGITGTEEFPYDKPLQLLFPNPSIYPGAKTEQDAKEQHFMDYWDGGNPDVGGIIWPHHPDGSIDQNNIWSIGVIVYQNNNVNGGIPQVIKSNYSGGLIQACDEELETDPEYGRIYRKRKEFAQYAYKFGQNADINDYYNTRVISSDSLVNIGNIPTKYVLENQQNKGEYAIFNGDETKKIKIVQGTSSEDQIENTDSNTITIYVGNHSITGYTLKAVIATAGKVSIESDGININGCIIAKDDLDITGSKVKITYDPEVIERVQAQNVDTFNAVFGASIVEDTNSSTSSTSGTGSATTNYNLKNFLENKLWKIIR